MFRSTAALTQCIVLIWLFGTLPTVAAAGLSDNLRASVDLSSRSIHSNHQNWSMHAVGLDVHKVFSSERADIGTLVFQPYFVHIEQAPGVPAIFDDHTDTALQWRIANFNYTGFGAGRFNVRVGHFELPFGLEQVVPTNGTLHQLNASDNTGLKADWGTSVNGSLPQFEYEVAYMKGAGNDFHTDANGLIVGRIGLPRDRRVSVGLSYLDGEFDAAPRNVQRQRVGIDARLQLARGFSLAVEHSQGKDDGADVAHELLELQWRNLSEVLTCYVQLRNTDDDRFSDDDYWTRLYLGVHLEPNRHWSISAAVSKATHRPVERSGGNTVNAQLRYRF